MDQKLLKSIGMLVGLTLGAGILGIPYVFAKAGFFTGLLILLLLGIVTIIINLYTAEVTLSTKGIHQLSGYAEKYLGRKGKFLMGLTMIISAYGAMIAYLLGIGEAVSTIFNIPSLYVILLFFILLSYAVLRGIRLIEILELGINCGVITVLVVIMLLSLRGISLQNFSAFHPSLVFLPFGVILFALAGAAAIPDMRMELDKDKKKLKKAIILGTIIPLVLYILFATVIVGVTGTETTAIATIGLGNTLGSYMIILGNIFAAFAMATSFLLMALALLWTYNYDYKFKKGLAWALTVFVPLFIILIGFHDFIEALALTGSIAGGLQGILIVLMHRKAQKNPERKPEFSIKNNIVLSSFIIVIYTMGMLYAIYAVF
ncbi:hypothetical protein HZA98_03365 [Candidatus Woesearchaeota archaeon]|nr:hypothetical protein [Candidatus Woesearchaeota archaeon]